jgi:hypothetical protein
MPPIGHWPTSWYILAAIVVGCCIIGMMVRSRRIVHASLSTVMGIMFLFVSLQSTRELGLREFPENLLAWFKVTASAIAGLVALGVGGYAAFRSAKIDVDAHDAGNNDGAA